MRKEFYLNQMTYEDYYIEFFEDAQAKKYYWQATYIGDDRRFKDFEDENAYPSKAIAAARAKKWVDEQKRK